MHHKTNHKTNQKTNYETNHETHDEMNSAMNHKTCNWARRDTRNQTGNCAIACNRQRNHPRTHPRNQSGTHTKPTQSTHVRKTIVHATAGIEGLFSRGALGSATHGKGQPMNTSNLEPPTLDPALPARSVTRRRRNAPRVRRGIGAHWHRRGEWRSVVTGGVAQPRSSRSGRNWMSIAALAAVATIAGVAVGVGAMRLGWIPATGAMTFTLVTLAFVATSAFAILACCIEIDGVLDREARENQATTRDRSDRT